MLSRYILGCCRRQSTSAHHPLFLRTLSLSSRVICWSKSVVSRTMAVASGSNGLSGNSDLICVVGDFTYFVNTPSENKSVNGILLFNATFFACVPLVYSHRPSNRVATCLFARIRPIMSSQAVLRSRFLPVLTSYQNCCTPLIFAAMFPYFPMHIDACASLA